MELSLVQFQTQLYKNAKGGFWWNLANELSKTNFIESNKNRSCLKLFRDLH